MVKVGILGFGFMGKMHFGCYKKRDDAQIVAICDADKERLQGGGVDGNVAGTEDALDLEGIELLADFDDMLDRVDMDVLSITLPTFLHPDFSCRALKKDVHVLCEKPMALTADACECMIETAQQTGKVLQIGHCVRFWPEYALAKERVDSGKYGKVLAASLRRLSLTPTWSQENWIMNAKRSGGVELDLHIHDSDFVQYLLGLPQAVYSTAATGPGGGSGHVMTQYVYDDNVTVFAEGGWMMAPSFGFEMSFNLVLEKATIVYDCTRDPALKVCPLEGDAFTPDDIPEGDGYEREIDHFLRAVGGETVPPITTLESSRDSVRIVEAEKQSIKTGQKISF